MKIFSHLASIVAAAAIALTAVFPAMADQHLKINVERPDMDKIKAEVTNPSSRYYYPKLFKRYERNETVMNLTDYRYLYLGAVFQEDYNPYRHSPLDSKNEELYYRNNHTKAELDSIILFAQAALEDDPFDLQQINFLIYGLRNRGKIHSAAIWQYRLNHLIGAILSTGTGADTLNAWVVIDPKHEYNIVNFKQQVVKQAQFMPPYYEFIETTDPDKVLSNGETAPTGYFFNIHHILREYYRKHPDQLTQ